MVQVDIKKLTPALAEEYIHFFDTTPHDTGKDEHKCYCVTWRSYDSYEEAHWFSSREERREHALRYVKNGSIQGYLAYHDDTVVGWCNANANCRHCIHYLQSFFPIEEPDENIKIQSIFCFVIAPDMQRKGIATQLVERVCKDAADDGFDFVEAYVNKNFTDTASDFRGPMELYKKCGFSVFAEQDDRAVMRKSLK